MNKILLIGLFLVLSFGKGVVSQDIEMASQAQYKQFISSKTYVVKYDNPFSGFNSAIDEAMKDCWRLTEWEIISWNEFEKKRYDKTSSFIFLSEAIVPKRPDMKFNVLNIVMGSSSSSLNAMPDLGSVPLSYVYGEDESIEDDYLFKLPLLLNFMQFYIEKNAKEGNVDIKSIVKQNSNKIADKEVWFLKEDLNNDVNSENKISKYYAGKVKIVSRVEIENAIALKQDILFLHRVAPGEGNTGKCLKFILSVKDGVPYYYNMTEVTNRKPDMFLIEDFKKL